MKKMMILWAFSLMTVTACSSETERQEPTETEQQTNKDQTMEQTNGNQTYLTLNNGVQMPQFGLGVYSIPAGVGTFFLDAYLKLQINDTKISTFCITDT